MAYADADFYTNTYGGALPADASLDKLLARASDDIDIATLYRIGTLGGLTALTDFCQQQIKMAVCAQADYVDATGGIADFGGLSGYSVGDVNVQLGAATGGYPALAPRARAYLLPTGLMNRGV